jgi:hypothetical protein
MTNQPRSTGLRVLTPDPAEPDPRAIRHAAIVKELAFRCYIDASGNAERARLELLEEFPKHDLDPSQLPTARIIRYWANQDGWRNAFTRAIRRDFSETIKFQAARMVQIHERALDVMDEVTRPGYVPQKDDRVRIDAARHMISTMADVMKSVAVQQQGEEGEQTPEFADAAEANRFWIKGGTTPD